MIRKVLALLRYLHKEAAVPERDLAHEDDDAEAREFRRQLDAAREWNWLAGHPDEKP